MRESVNERFYRYLSRIKTSGDALLVSGLLASLCSLLSVVGTNLAFQNIDSPILPIVKIMAYLLPFALVLVSSFMLIRGFAHLDQRNKYLTKVAERDDLTRLANRATFFRRGKELLIQAELQHSPLSLILLDADHFKSINDTYGHLAGDLALQHLAEILRHSSRDNDLVARWGGEEFAILLRSANLTGARTFAERLRQSVANSPFIWQGKTVTITMSAGVTELWEEDDFEAMVLRADKALYCAKSAGRNQVQIAGIPADGEEDREVDWDGVAA